MLEMAGTCQMLQHEWCLKQIWLLCCVMLVHAIKLQCTDVSWTIAPIGRGRRNPQSPHLSVHTTLW